MDQNDCDVLRKIFHAESAESYEGFHMVLRILRVIESKLHHQLHVDIPWCQIIRDTVLNVVDVLHPSVGNDIGNVEQVEDIHANIHIPDISQRVVFAETAGLADELLAEADVDAAIGLVTCGRVIKVRVVAVDGETHAKG